MKSAGGDRTAEQTAVASAASQRTAFARVAAEVAYSETLESSASKWPTRANPARLEPLCLPAIRRGFKLDSGASVFTIGSCFARNIETSLKKKGFSVPALDFTVPPEELWPGTHLQSGILNKYTPHSMLNEILFALGSTDGSEFLIETRDGLVWDAQLHTIVGVERKRALERRQQIRELYHSAMAASSLVVITLGLIECWWDNETNQYLNETVPPALLKKYPGRFEFEVLGPESTIACTSQLIDALHQANPEQRAMITVSPVPLHRTFSTSPDVITANAYSKSVLRVAAEVVTRQFDHVDYYPSFESVTHSDRLFAWEDDLVHVRQQIVSANVDQMLTIYAGD